MKTSNLNLFIFIVGMIFILSSCQSTKKYQVLTQKIQYDVPVMNKDTQVDWWINNIEGSKREPFLQRIIEAAKKGDIKVYDYFGKPLDPSQVLSAGTDTVYQTLKRTRPPYEDYDTMIVKAVTYHDVTRIRFLEEWTWDPETLEIQKKIMAIGPVFDRQFGDLNYTQLLFWIYYKGYSPEGQ